MKFLPSLLALAIVPALVFTVAAARPDDKKPAPVAGNYTIDPVHSSVIFQCMHVGTSWAFGRFDTISGTFMLDPAKPENAKVEVTIDAASVNTANTKRDGHLKSPDFLDVKQFPTATFKSKSVAKKGDHGYAVTGDLTLHGVTKSVTIDMEHTGGIDHPQMGKKIGFYGTLSISRSAYGINYMPDGLGDEIKLILSVEGDAK